MVQGFVGPGSVASGFGFPIGLRLLQWSKTSSFRSCGWWSWWHHAVGVPGANDLRFFLAGPASLARERARGFGFGAAASVDDLALLLLLLLTGRSACTIASSSLSASCSRVRFSEPAAPLGGAGIVSMVASAVTTGVCTYAGSVAVVLEAGASWSDASRCSSALAAPGTAAPDCPASISTVTRFAVPFVPDAHVSGFKTKALLGGNLPTPSREDSSSPRRLKKANFLMRSH